MNNAARTNSLIATLALGLAGFGPLGADTFDGKAPPYFVDRYGPAKSSEVRDKASFVLLGKGSVTLKGQYSVRAYRQDKLRIDAVFLLPSLELASVRLTMNQPWTEEQITAALQAYGGAWKPLPASIGIVAWEAPDGARAISMLNSLIIQSKATEDALTKEYADLEAKRKAVPKF